MTTTDETLQSAMTSFTAGASTRQYISHWRTAEERAEGLKAKKQRRRAAHRIRESCRCASSRRANVT